jgi:uncharacterized membrane protein HdeD (DUF308 family)
MNTGLISPLAHNWWMLLLRGVAAIIFGMLALLWPKLTLFTLILFYGISTGVQGIFEIVAAIRGGTLGSRWWLALEGIAALGAAAVTLLLPKLTALLLLYIIGGWAIARGIFEIMGAIQLRKVINNEWLLILSGLLSVAFGVFVFLRPGATALTLVWFIGAYAIVEGVLFIALSLRLHRHQPATA